MSTSDIIGQLNGRNVVVESIGEEKSKAAAGVVLSALRNNPELQQQFERLMTEQIK